MTALPPPGKGGGAGSPPIPPTAPPVVQRAPAAPTLPPPVRAAPVPGTVPEMLLPHGRSVQAHADVGIDPSAPMSRIDPGAPVSDVVRLLRHDRNAEAAIGEAVGSTMSETVPGLAASSVDLHVPR